MASNYNQDGQIPIPPRRTRSSTSDKVMMVQVNLLGLSGYSFLH